MNYLRTALLNEPAVIDHLLHLVDLRDVAVQATHERFATGEIGRIEGGVPKLAPGAREQLRYWQAREASLLREQFHSDEIDHLAAIIRERLEGDSWGLLTPVNPYASGYGREKQRARAMSPDTIELATLGGVGELLVTRKPPR